MIATIRDGIYRLKRSVAQRGLRNALSNVTRRITQGNLKMEAAHEYPVAPHPFDVETGVDTSGMIDARALATGHEHDIYNVVYYGTSPSLFHAAIEEWLATPGVRPVEEYTFVDFGCGKGRVVMMAAERGFRECVGVELNAGLAKIAAANVLKWAESGRPKSPMRAVCEDATAFEFPATPCVVYLFNPFTGKVLAKLLDKIASVFAARPGEVDVVYVNSEFREVLDAHPGFTKLWEKPLRMTDEDAAIDIEFTGDGTGKKQYGEVGTEICGVWRWTGIAKTDIA
jgi:SAM-dependent methyltransferase